MAGNQHRVTLRRLLCSLCLCQHSWCQVSFPMNLVGNQIPYFSQQNTEGIGEREQRSWQDLSWYTFVTNDAVGLPEKLQGFGTIKQEEHPIASDKYGWELVLVNRDNYIPDDYEMDLMELSNGQKIDSRIYPYLQEMFDDARNAGVYPFVRDGYRTAEEQQQILDDKITAYRSEGYTKHMAEETAMEWVALPGTSEHQLGLAVDINADTSKCSRDDVYNWLLENSYKYGFIQRYPSGKTSITGVANEPWHYRYVGKKAAEEIHQSGMCLEEYVENLK